MRLPSFLKFLEPRFNPKPEHVGIRGHLLVERQVDDGPVELWHDSKNLILFQGLTAVRDILIGPNGAGFTGSIFRMAIGDGGTPPGELFSPIDPSKDDTGLQHEVIRQDISIFEGPTDFSMRFVTSFLSTDVSNTSFSTVDQVINEAGLVIGDGILTVGGDKRQINKVPPDTVDADEVTMSVRTFNSVPFSTSDNVTVTITWTITVGG